MHLVLFAALAAACGPAPSLAPLRVDDDATDAATDAHDSGPQSDGDSGAAVASSCGGDGRLSGTVGAPCGPCGDGVQACDGPEATICLGGSHEPCDAEPALGTACGRCGGV